MASDKGKSNTPPAGSDRAKMMRVLIPSVAVGLIVVLVAVIAGMSDGGGKKMSDGSNGTVDDPDLKEIVPGVKYRDIKEGSGDPCPEGATVKAYYTGWLKDGSEFDSNKKSKTPAQFKLTSGDRDGPGVIPGWQAGIPGMKPGGIRKLVIEAGKGYGNQAQPKIPPLSTLIFEVELVSVVPEANYKTGKGQPMSDGSDGGTDDPALKEIANGLKFRDLKEGSGEPVKPHAKVTVNYTGWLTDGTVFDSSKKHGESSSFSLDEVVKGWGEGIPGMKPGGIRKLVIPPALGYPGGRPGIPPNATLIFEVELIKVN